MELIASGLNGEFSFIELDGEPEKALMFDKALIFEEFADGVAGGSFGDGDLGEGALMAGAGDMVVDEIADEGGGEGEEEHAGPDPEYEANEAFDEADAWRGLGSGFWGGVHERNSSPVAGPSPRLWASFRASQVWRISVAAILSTTCLRFLRRTLALMSIALGLGGGKAFVLEIDGEGGCLVECFGEGEHFFRLRPRACLPG